MQRLATLTEDNRPIDFGLSITFANGLMIVRGRADSPSYASDWEFTENQITLSNVADNYKIPSGVTEPGIPLGIFPSVSRPRFDAFFAESAGEANYQNVLSAIKAIADIEPVTNDSAQVRRAWAAFSNPPSTGIDYPISDWTDPAALNPIDLTGSFFALIVGALSGDFADIEQWLIDGCVAWSKYKVE